MLNAGSFLDKVGEASALCALQDRANRDGSLISHRLSNVYPVGSEGTPLDEAGGEFKLDCRKEMT